MYRPFFYFSYPLLFMLIVGEFVRWGMPAQEGSARFPADLQISNLLFKFRPKGLGFTRVIGDGVRVFAWLRPWGTPSWWCWELSVLLVEPKKWVWQGKIGHYQ